MIIVYKLRNDEGIIIDVTVPEETDFSNTGWEVMDYYHLWIGD